MTDPTTDQKIEQLVRSVLAAVDTRLGEVRDQMQSLAADVERRQAGIMMHLQELERRLEHGALEVAPTGADPLAARMEQATQVLLERIEAMHQRNTMATNERFANLSASIELLRSAPAPGALPPTPIIPGLDQMSAPLCVPVPAMTTGPIPVLSITSPPLEPAPPVGSEPIDLGKLADLLTDRLGQLSLPPRPN